MTEAEELLRDLYLVSDHKEDCAIFRYVVPPKKAICDCGFEVMHKKTKKFLEDQGILEAPI